MQRLLAGEIRHKEVGRNAAFDIRLRRGNEHDLFPAQRLTGARDAQRVHQRLARAAPDKIDLKAAALIGKEIGRMRADIGGLEFTRAEDDETVRFTGRRGEKRLARDLFRNLRVGAQRIRVVRHERMDKHCDASQKRRRQHERQNGRKEAFFHFACSASAAIFSGVEILSRSSSAASSTQP